jgi:ATP-dependent Zn protease
MFKEVKPISFTPVVPSQTAPVEVAYSRFMDYCEDKNVQDQHIDNVQVEGSKITFRLVRAETRAQRASLGRMKQQKHNNPVQQHLPGTDDLKTTSAYTQAMDGTNSELIHFLRKNDIPFRATATMKTVSKQGGDFPTTLAVAGGAIYLYKNGGFSSKTGKKAKTAVVPISFDDIEGIDEAKHDVLELVDTLRNPEKYSLVGARAPTGLLLEGLPGTGKVSKKRSNTKFAYFMSDYFSDISLPHPPQRRPWPVPQHPWQTFL